MHLYSTLALGNDNDSRLSCTIFSFFGTDLKYKVPFGSYFPSTIPVLIPEVVSDIKTQCHKGFKACLIS